MTFSRRPTYYTIRTVKKGVISILSEASTVMVRWSLYDDSDEMHHFNSARTSSKQLTKFCRPIQS
jgi:hypothetical protein